MTPDPDGVWRDTCTVCGRRIGVRFNGSGASTVRHKPLRWEDADLLGQCKGWGEWAGGYPSGGVFQR